MSSILRLPHAQYTHLLEIFPEQLIKKSAEILSRKQAQPWQDRSWPSRACWSLMPDYEATQKGHLLETYKVDPIYPLKGPRLSESAEKQPISSFKSRRVYFADTSRRLEIAGLSLGGRLWRRITVIAGGDKDGMVGIRFCVSQSGYVGVNRLWEFECWLQLSWRQRHTLIGVNFFHSLKKVLGNISGGTVPILRPFEGFFCGDTPPSRTHSGVPPNAWKSQETI